MRKIGAVGAILVTNHCLYLEPVFTGLAVWSRKLWYTAEMNNVTRKDIGWLNRLLGAFGIPERNPMRISRTVGELLGRGDLIQFFPEGRLYLRNQQLRTFFAGAFCMALRFNAPVLPVTEVLLPRRVGRYLSFLPPRVKLIFGEPLFPEEIIRNNSVDLRLKRHAGQFAETVRAIMQKTINGEHTQWNSRNRKGRG